MLKRIIARVDVKNDTMVKGINLEGLRNLGYPELYSKLYYDEGIDEIHYQDVVASLYGRNTLDKVINKSAKNIFVIMSVGGGIRSLGDIDRVLRNGADKVSLNTAAVYNPDLIRLASEVYGSSTISINIETQQIDGNFEVLVESGRQRTGQELFSYIEKIQKLGAGEICVTSIFHEGRQKGSNLDLYKTLRKHCSVPLIAHGGINSKEEIYKLFSIADVDGVSIASLFHYSYLEKKSEISREGRNVFLNSEKNSFDKKNKIKIFDIKQYLLKNGVKIRE